MPLDAYDNVWHGSNQRSTERSFAINLHPFVCDCLARLTDKRPDLLGVSYATNSITVDEDSWRACYAVFGAEYNVLVNPLSLAPFIEAALEPLTSEVCISFRFGRQRLPNVTCSQFPLVFESVVVEPPEELGALFVRTCGYLGSCERPRMRLEWKVSKYKSQIAFLIRQHLIL